MSCELPTSDKADMLEYALFTVIERCTYFETEHKKICEHTDELRQKVSELIKENADLTEDVVKLKNRILELGGSDNI